MKVVFCALIFISALSATVKQGSTTVDVLQPAELLTQLFGQSVDTLVQSLELQLLTSLYPDNAADIQAELDDCEANYWSSAVTSERSIGLDLSSLASACTSPDPSAPVSQLIQDTLQFLANLAAPCDGLSVDLIGDIENVIATAIVTGFAFGQVWTGPLTQWTASSVLPLAGSAQYLAPVAQAVDSLAQSTGVSSDTVAKTDNDTATFNSAWTAVLNDLSTAGAPTTVDTLAVLSSFVTLTNDYGQEYTEVLASSAQFASQGLVAACAFVTPAAEAASS